MANGEIRSLAQIEIPYLIDMNFGIRKYIKSNYTVAVGLCEDTSEIPISHFFCDSHSTPLFSCSVTFKVQTP